MRNFRHFGWVALLILLNSLAARAQLDNRAFLTPLAADSGQARELRVRVPVFFFNKDNEYFGKIADGYTLFGVAARPQLTWQPTAHVKLAAGVFFRQDFGNQQGPNGGSRLRQIRPALTAVWQADSWRFLFGALDGHLHHGLAEPLYDFERVMLRRPEEGIQFTGDTKRLRYDLWINWEHMQYPRDSAQEAVSGGLSALIDVVGAHQPSRIPGASLAADDPWHPSRYHFSGGIVPTEWTKRHSRSFGLRIPIQFTGRHIGGQIDTIDRPLQTYFVGATGLRAVWRWDSTYFLHGLRLEALGTGFLDYSFTRRLPFPSGKGIYLNAALETKLTTLWLSYWRGDGFSSPGLGGVVYSSLGTTVSNPGYYRRHRELIILRLTHDYRLWNHGFLTTRAEPYYDLLDKRFEFNLGLYLTGLLDERVAGGR